MRLRGSDPLDLFAEAGRCKTDSEDEPRWEAGAKNQIEKKFTNHQQSAISKNGMIRSNKET